MTDGLLVSILPNVNPFEVPNDVIDNIWADEEFSVALPALLSEYVNICDPLTLNSVGPPLDKLPNPNSCASAASDDSLVESVVFEVYDIAYELCFLTVFPGNIVPPTAAKLLSIKYCK